MITLERLILNEIKSAIGHEPTPEEIHSVSEYLATKKIDTLTQLEVAIYIEWKNKFTTECGWCGDRFLNETMIQTSGNERFCCDQCKKDYETEHGRIK